MKVIEQNQEKLVLRSQNPLVLALLIGIVSTLASLFLSAVGLVLQQAEYAGNILVGMGGIVMIGGIFAAIKLPKSNTYTFDKSGDRLLFEQRSLYRPTEIKSLEFPAKLIVGVEIADFSDAESTSYYPRLLVTSEYWRMILRCNGRYSNAVSIAKILSEFLNVTYFPDVSKAPQPIYPQKILENAQPWQFHWKYLENEIDRLQQHLSQYPDDGLAHQKLGISLYYLNRSRTDAVAHLQQAERLFEASQESDRATIARVIGSIISWVD